MADEPRQRRLRAALVSAYGSPRATAIVMFVCFWLVAVLAVQRTYGLGMPSPSSRLLSLGGFLTGSGRALGIAGLPRSGMETIYSMLVVVIFACYVRTLWLLARKGRHLSAAFIIGASVAFCLWVLFVPPLLAKDLFNNASYGQALALHGRNPYVVPPSAFPGDHVLKYIGWKDTVSVYGPFFNYLAAATAAISRDGAVSSIIAFKLMPFAFFTGSLLLLNDVAGRLHPDRREFILVAAAWNPLVIIHLVGGGHNDTIMLFFILLSFLLYRQGKPVLALISCLLATLVKSTAALVLVPMAVLFLRQNARWALRKYVGAAAALAGTAAAFYLPLWPGANGFMQIISVGTGFNAASVPSLTGDLAQHLLHAIGLRAAAAAPLGLNLSRVLFMLAFLALFVAFTYRVRDLHSLIFYSGAILYAFMMTTTWLMPWYAGFAVVILALSGSYLMTCAGIGLTFVMSFMGRGLNEWPSATFPVLLLVLTVGVVAIALGRRLPFFSRGSMAGAEP
ncbi:MAG: polyprenol phosphomannose-dependent alpha 1,6 mannosyltransferase MptB [Candidatus Geothermincolia bacterium]